MSNMKSFHKLLFASSNQDAYLAALRSFTKVSSVQLVSMTRGLDWQIW